jgi:hypothetical protein
LLFQTAKFIVERIASKNIKYQAKARGIQDAECIAEMLAVEGTGASAGRRDNIVMSRISTYGLSKGMDGQKGTGNKKWMDVLEYSAQTIEELTLHIAKFQCYKRSLGLEMSSNLSPPLTISTRRLYNRPKLLASLNHLNS